MTIKQIKSLIIKSWFNVFWGLEIVNKFKYLGAGIFGLYVLIKFESIIWLPMMFFTSLPILYLLGWLWVNKMSKALDRMNTDESTYYSKYNFNLMEDQVRSLRKVAGLPYEKEDMDKLKPIK